MTHLAGPGHAARNKHVLQAASQASSGKLAGKGETAPVHRGQVIEREPAQLLNLTRLGPHLAATDCSGEDREQQMAAVGNSNQAAKADVQPGLLACLARRGFLQRFAGVRHPAGQCPQPRPVRLLHQQDTTALDEQDERREICATRWCPVYHPSRPTMGRAQPGRFRACCPAVNQDGLAAAGGGKDSLAVVGLSFIHFPFWAGLCVPFFILYVLPLLLARKHGRLRRRRLTESGSQPNRLL